ncbi:MAG: glycosyl transferase, group 1 [Rhodopila sp.]|jgi:glycosyltransferase involved in cell wall biosynthesis|nr:glycosyl transferase, group 1 [Rhodopila sp.]
MIDGRPIWLDVARLLERACIGSLTGIDRVELAYAENLIALAPERIRFVMLGRWSSQLSLLPDFATRAFLQGLREAWTAGRPEASRGSAIRLMARAAVAPPPQSDSRAVYLLVSHRHLDRQAALENVLRRSAATFVPLIHDLIPLEFPEYGRPGEAVRHRHRLATVARLADGVVTNSAATAMALAPYLPADRTVHVAPLGVSAPVADIAPEKSDRPYFLCVGTIEPRKNHLLLLHLWRRLVALQGNQAPRLLIVGHRGWENENVLDLLDRCTALRGHVVELGIVPDTKLTALLRGARALLMPSFAEGFGLPVAEALAHGTPVLCSDLPALREAGGPVPEYLDPLDTPGWHAAVLEYAAEMSPRRDAQIARLPRWIGTTWDAHVGSVLQFLDSMAPRSRHLPASSDLPLLLRHPRHPEHGEAISLA